MAQLLGIERIFISMGKTFKSYQIPQTINTREHFPIAITHLRILLQEFQTFIDIPHVRSNFAFPSWHIGFQIVL